MHGYAFHAYAYLDSAVRQVVISEDIFVHFALKNSVFAHTGKT